MIEGMPTGPENKKSLFEEMVEKDPSKNAIYNAIQNLKDPEEIKEFFKGYIEKIQPEGGFSADQIATRNIQYFVKMSDDPEIIERWSVLGAEEADPAYQNFVPYDKKAIDGIDNVPQ